jgi:tellurite methyltransferase
MQSGCEDKSVRILPMPKPQQDWSEYHEITQAHPPSKLLVKALEYVINKNKAIDIGAGALKNTRYLLEQGFDVTVIDKSPLAEQEAKTLMNDKVHAFTTSFEDFAFPENEYDLAAAMFALPFIEPLHFETVFKKIKKSLKPGGIFCGQFFGMNDEWAKNPAMTFHTAEQVRALLDGLEIISFNEVEKDGTTVNGEAKHWHIFHIIARK